MHGCSCERRKHIIRQYQSIIDLVLAPAHDLGTCSDNEDAAANLLLSLIMFLLLCGSCLLLEQIRVRVQQRIVASLELPINLSDLQHNHDVSLHASYACIDTGKQLHTRHTHTTIMCHSSPSASSFNMCL